MPKKSAYYTPGVVRQYTIEARTPMMPDVHITYRPLTTSDLNAYSKRGESLRARKENSAEANAEAMTLLIENHLKEWDLTDDQGKVLEFRGKAARDRLIKHVDHVLLRDIFNAIFGSLSDEPEDADGEPLDDYEAKNLSEDSGSTSSTESSP